jgi:hypothetical protein
VFDARSCRHCLVALVPVYLKRALRKAFDPLKNTGDVPQHRKQMTLSPRRFAGASDHSAADFTAPSQPSRSARALRLSTLAILAAGPGRRLGKQAKIDIHRLEGAVGAGRRESRSAPSAVVAGGSSGANRRQRSVRREDRWSHLDGPSTPVICPAKRSAGAA